MESFAALIKFLTLLAMCLGCMALRYTGTVNYRAKGCPTGKIEVYKDHGTHESCANYTDFKNCVTATGRWEFFSNESRAIIKDADLYCTEPINRPTIRSDMFDLPTTTPRNSNATAFSSFRGLTFSRGSNVQPEKPYNSDHPIKYGAVLASFGALLSICFYF